MEYAILIGFILTTIHLFFLIRSSYEKQKNRQIVIFQNKYDIIFNTIVYLAPAIVFIFKNQYFNNLKCYILICTSFSIMLFISAFQNNTSFANKIEAGLIKIIFGVETIFILASLLIIIALLLSIITGVNIN